MKNLNLRMWVLCALMSVVLCPMGSIQVKAARTAESEQYVGAVSGDYTYSVWDEEVRIEQYNGTEEHVVIPSTIDGMAVTTIRQNAFMYAESVISIVVPEGVKKIYANALSAENIQRIELPASWVEVIGDSDVPSNCNVPGNGKNMKAFIVAADNPVYAAVDGALYDKALTILYGYPAGKTQVNLPQGLKRIGQYAFGGNENITEVILPEGLEYIEAGAFRSCSSLKKAVFPNSLREIGKYAFNYCDLTSVVLPANVKTVGNYCFDGMENLTSVKILGDDVLIGWEAFYGCDKLERVEFVGDVVEIGSSAFSGCYAMKEVVFGGTVGLIGRKAFTNLSDLAEITLPEGLEEIGESAFFACSSLKNVTVPSTTKKIGESAFGTRHKFITIVGSGSWHKVYEPGVENITILNPQCEIFDSEETIRPSTIYGYNGSTAEKYAEKYNRNFISLGDYVKPADEEQVRAFVSRMYTVALNRAAEPQGLEDWTKRLVTREVDGAGIAYGFILSEEFTNRNLSNADYVDVLYETFLNRASDAEGKADWVSRLETGSSRKYILAGFVNSVEFDGLCKEYGINRGTMDVSGESSSNTGIRGFVERLYTKALGREGDEAGIKYWSNAISTGAMSAETVAKKFFFSEEFANKNLGDEIYVETLYRTFMDREADADGKAFWVENLESGMSRDAVLEGFSQSKEFAAILESYGL